MFWQYELTTTNINNLLERDDITLQEILEEEDVLQELRTENHKLVKFLMKDENLGQLVSMIVSEPDESIEMNKQFKHASLACELLTAEINQTEMLSDLLIDDNKRSDDFFGFGQFGNNDKIMSSTSQTFRPKRKLFVIKFNICKIKIIKINENKFSIKSYQ